MLLCMRTTIQLDDQLLLEAKKHAAQTGRTLKAVIEDALREALARTEAARLHTSPFEDLQRARCAARRRFGDTSSLLDSIERDGGTA